MTKPSNVSHEQRVAWGHMGGSATAASLTANERRLSSKKANAAKYAKYGHEELSQKYAGCFTRILARMTPEQAAAVRKGAGQKRWAGVSPEERSSINRRLIQRRWDRVAYAKNPAPADQLFDFLQDFISAKGYSPSMCELHKAIHHDRKATEKLLRMLEATGRIQRQAWDRGITLVDVQTPTAVLPVVPVQESGTQFLSPILPRSARKCYDCDSPAIEGKARCEKHLAIVRESSKRSQARSKIYKRSHPHAGPSL
jgi:hypothetical protein